MTKDFKNSGLISQVAEFIDKKRIEEGISIDTLCQSAHLSQHTDEEKFKEIWLEIAKIMTNLEE